MSDNEKSRALLEKYFDTAFAAPEGIKKLRELILTLAMQGKLVPQDPSDQPASELLKEIEAEKRRLVKAGKIREPKPLPEIKPEERPYELPVGWVWVRLCDVFCLEYGHNLPAEKRSNSGEYPVYGSNGIVGTHNICFVKSPCIVVGRKGSAGALNLSLTTGCCVTDVAYYSIPPNGIDLHFSFKLFHTIGLERLGKGIKPGLNRNAAYQLPIAIPPLAEQHRIVARIDQLMARCDELEKLRTEREAKRLTVHISALNRLFEAQRNDSFTDAWHFINHHFGELYSVKQNVTELRKAILQLGVMGKLVPQDPNDQPASELLKEIEAEKRRLVKAGKIREPKPLPEIKPDEVPYALPVSWAWVRLGEISEVNGGFAFKSSKYVNDGVRVVRISDFDEKGFKNHKIVRYTFSADLNIFKLEPNNILMAMTGGTVGKSLLVKALSEPMVVNQRVATIKILSGILPEFVNSLIQTDLIQRVIYTAKNSTNDNISMGDITGFYVPLPPFAEQKRIVTRIDQFMAMCDELEHQIDATASKQSALLSSVMVNI